MSYDQLFRKTAPYNLAGKSPHIYFSDQEIIGTGYVNNSLEGLLFNSLSGQVVLPSGSFTPNWNFYTAGAETPITIDPTGPGNAYNNVTIVDKVCTIVCTGTTDLLVGDVVSINGTVADSFDRNINGSWVVKTVSQTNVSNDTFSFEINAPNSTFTNFPVYVFTNQVRKGHVFQIKDSRPTTDAKGRSFTSAIFTLLSVLDGSAGYRRILPSDLYLRFRFQTGSDTDPKGGINSNLFSVLDTANNNIKPVLWAYFFGYSSADLPSTRSATIFELAFNSYAIVLRPTGTGSRLEFALLKFSWGTIPTSYWMSSIVDTDRFKNYTVSGTELGYLIPSNPLVGQVAGSRVVTEIAVSDSFTYDSEFAAKFNLKITVRKHLLTDSELDGTYLVNLMVNDDYGSFGPGKRYDSVLHGYIPKPSPNLITTVQTQQVDDMRLAPMFYFKFNNVNEQNVGEPDLSSSPPVPGSSKIVLDNIFFRQINSSTNTPYLY